jgi:ribosomal protein S27AE
VQGLGLLVILFFFGLAGGIVGAIKGSSFFIWFLVSACVPFLGLLAAVFYRYDTEELRRECPECGKVIKLHDAVCVRCGTELSFPDVAIASEGSIRRASPRRRAA